MKRRISLLFHLKWHQCTETLNITGNSITLNYPKCSALCSLKKYFLYRFTFTRRVIPLTCLCGVSLFHYCWCRCCKRQHCQPGYRPKQETNMTIYIWPGKLRSLRTCRQVLLLIDQVERMPVLNHLQSQWWGQTQPSTEWMPDRSLMFYLGIYHSPLLLSLPPPSMGFFSFLFSLFQFFKNLFALQPTNTCHLIPRSYCGNVQIPNQTPGLYILHYNSSPCI